MTNSTALEQMRMSPEGRDRTSFVYDLLRVPNTFFTGVADPRLEARFYDKSGRLLLGPDQIAAVMESVHADTSDVRYQLPKGAESISISELTGRLTIAPGETKLVRVEFAPGLFREGVWTWHADRVYREYHVSADPAYSMPFGNSDLKGNVIAVANSGKEPLTFRWEFVSNDETQLKREGGPFATFHVSTFVIERSPIRVQSIDERVVIDVDAPEPGVLETFRSHVPGYRATVDGKPAEITTNENHLVCIPLDAGTHRVELTYAPTLRTRIGGWITFASLLVLAGFVAKRFRARSVDTGSADA